MDIELVEGAVYAHYKGNSYRLLHLARHSETGEDMVVYQALYGDGEIWVRPREMFTELVHIQNDGCTGEWVMRFRRVLD